MFVPSSSDSAKFTRSLNSRSSTIRYDTIRYDTIRYYIHIHIHIAVEFLAMKRNVRPPALYQHLNSRQRQQILTMNCSNLLVGTYIQVDPRPLHTAPFLLKLRQLPKELLIHRLVKFHWQKVMIRANGIEPTASPSHPACTLNRPS